MNEIDKVRLGLIPALAEGARTGCIGRTALMKYVYFLQTLRGLPLGYSFSMYSYGPFDPAVLSDLDSAQALNIVKSEPVQFAGGYGYRIKPGPRAALAKEEAGSLLAEHKADFEWLFSSLGHLNSAELELISTIVYVDQELLQSAQQISTQEMVTRLQEIKPHFDRERIEAFVEDLLQKGMLKATVRSLSRCAC
jgi:uncharacterized protein